MNISLPPTLRQWVDHQVESRGFGTASEFVRDMIRREREKNLHAHLDQQLRTALQTPVKEITEGYWDDLQRAGKKLARRRKIKT